MRAQEIVEFVKKYIEPLPAEHPIGQRYRVSATLVDGTYLPCVVVESLDHWVDLAIRRFDESRQVENPPIPYRAIVSSFVTHGNRVSDYDIKELTPSRYAIPLARLCEIRGETSMGWTAFSAVMKDGRELRFGTTFSPDFFEMPEGYAGTDIQKIIPAPRGEAPRLEGVYLARPFFTCYVDGLS